MKKSGYPFPESGDDGGLMNLTPLLDVLFVVLIMFMLIAPLLEIDRVVLAPGNHEEKENPSLTPSSHIKIYVQKDNSLWINSKKIPITHLTPALEKLKAQYPTDSPQLFLDESSQFGNYQRIKNCVENMGYKTLDIFLKSESSE